jgi:hypothetical protein
MNIINIKKLLNYFIVSLLIAICNLIFLTSPANASGEFTTDYNVTYTVKENGVTEVANKITLTNTFSNTYATSYSIVLDSIKPINPKAFGSDGTVYSLETITEDSKTTLKIEFPDAVVGKDKSRIFNVNFDENSFAVKTGEVWEISIPKVSEDASFASYNLKLLVPEKFGQEAYISPNPKQRLNQNEYLQYEFNKTDLQKTGVVAGFGAFQVFSFNLSYHLENPLAKKSITEITLPPDTAYQKVYYDDLNPRPSSMYVDSDGNWIAEYTLEPRQRVDVTTKGEVQIFSNYRPFLKPSQEVLNQNLVSSEYWDINNPEIVNLAKSLKTPKAIYDYVSTKLNYDYERVKANVERYGAVKALENPQSAICMEFTDLFIAIARSAGIPAREVNGFAYTENPEIQPLSLVNDVLHAWPEYYDSEKQVWVPVDPTWGSTTGGVDYFSKLDLRHFTFVIHGKDSKTPYAAGSYKLGSNPQKDVYVTFGSLPIERNPSLQVNAKIESWIPLMPNKLDINIMNTGPVAVYNILPKTFFDDVNTQTMISKNIPVLLPYQTYKSYLDIPFSFLAAKTPDNVKIVANESEIVVSTNKKQVIVYNLLFIFLTFTAILSVIFINLRKWKFPKKHS